MTGNVPREAYIHGHHDSVVASHAARTADEAAAFLLPRLKRGIRLIDIGCGPGSITTGLARALAPGEVVGIDMGDSVIAQAREAASAQGVLNVKFEVGSAYSLPYQERTFDAGYMHQVLQHLSRPADALSEARRVLKPGGVFGVREVDWGSTVIWPRLPLLDRFLEIYHSVAARGGGDADAGRRVRAWLNEAAFQDITLSASTWVFPGRDTTAAHGESWAQRTLRSNIATRAIELGISTREELERVSQAWLEWGQDPDAFFCFVHIEGVGTVPDGG